MTRKSYIGRKLVATAMLDVAIQAEPFRPFLIRTLDGSKHAVAGPDKAIVDHEWEVVRVDGVDGFKRVALGDVGELVFLDGGDAS